MTTPRRRRIKFWRWAEEWCKEEVDMMDDDFNDWLSTKGRERGADELLTEMKKRCGR